MFSRRINDQKLREIILLEFLKWQSNQNENQVKFRQINDDDVISNYKIFFCEGTRTADSVEKREIHKNFVKLLKS